MGGKLSASGYDTTLLQLIQEGQQTADMYMGASRNMKGDKKDLFLRLYKQEQKNISQMERIYQTLYSTSPHTATTVPIKTTVNDIILQETKTAIRLSHMSKSAPTKELSTLYKSMAQNSIQNGYLLLLIL